MYERLHSSQHLHAFQCVGSLRFDSISIKHSLQPIQSPQSSQFSSCLGKIFKKIHSTIGNKRPTNRRNAKTKSGVTQGLHLFRNYYYMHVRIYASKKKFSLHSKSCTVHVVVNTYVASSLFICTSSRRQAFANDGFPNSTRCSKLPKLAPLLPIASKHIFPSIKLFHQVV